MAPFSYKNYTTSKKLLKKLHNILPNSEKVKTVIHLSENQKKKVHHQEKQQEKLLKTVRQTIKETKPP